MNDMPEEDIETRRKRLLYRAIYTGMKETDLLFGGFAREFLPSCDEKALDEFEHLLTADDQTLYGWAIGREAPPPEYDNSVMKALQAYRFKVIR